MKNNLYLRLIAGAIALLGFVVPAAAGITSAGMNLGNTSAWTAKQTFYTATTSAASINLPHGTAPSSPVNGDIWTTSAGGLFGRINSNTKTYANLETAQTWSGQQTFGTSPLKFTHGIISDGNGNGSTTGNARGTGAIDLQTNRSAATQVASGNYSTVIGYRNTGSGTYSFAAGQSNLVSGNNGSGAIGSTNTVSGGYSFATGYGNSITATGGFASGDQNTLGSGSYATGLGSQNISNGLYGLASGYICETGVNSEGAIAFGVYAKNDANRSGALVQASGRISASGDSQTSRFSLRKQTTDATPAELKMGTGGTQTIGLGTGTSRAWAFKALVVGTTSSGDSAAYEITGAMKRVGSTTSLIGAVTVVAYEDAGASAWDATISADNTNDELDITVTGAAATTINWHSTVTISQVLI